MKVVMEKSSTILIRKTRELKQVKISSNLKPDIEENVCNKWQALIDTAARLAQVPSGLIMRLNEETIEVFLKSNTDGNPYEKGEKASLTHGLYCETVIGTHQKLLVPDATNDCVWAKNNPDVEINMISYLGFPINWPDGEVFGTVCLLDSKENYYNKEFENLLLQISQHVENDLNLLLLNEDLNKKNTQLQQLDHTKSRFLSLISHDVRGGIATVNEFLKLLINDFDSYKRDTLKNYLISLSENISTANETLESLLSWSKSDIVQMKPQKTFVDITDIVNDVLDYFSQRILLKDIKVVTSFYSSTIIVNTDENMLNVIVRNLISNAIKYNNKSGELKITIDKNQEKHILTIEDTGVGMSKDTIEKLFSYNENHARGTDGESSAGIGLILTKEFIDKLGLKVSFNSKINKGTSFQLEI